jgi:hypothetical protein
MQASAYTIELMKALIDFGWSLKLQNGEVCHFAYSW